MHSSRAVSRDGPMPLIRPSLKRLILYFLTAFGLYIGGALLADGVLLSGPLALAILMSACAAIGYLIISIRPRRKVHRSASRDLDHQALLPPSPPRPGLLFTLGVVIAAGAALASWAAIDQLAAGVIVTVIVSATSEELAFRRLPAAIESRYGRPTTTSLAVFLGITTLLFIASHGITDPWLMLDKAIFAACAYAACRRFRSLVIPSAMHIIANSWAATMLREPVQMPRLLFYVVSATILSLAAVLLAHLSSLRRSRVDTLSSM